jgi:hypothetical protein
VADDAPSSRADDVRTRVAVDVFSGVGLGLLLGVVLGLSVTPVVSIVVGALASVLAVFLGLDTGEGSGTKSLDRIRLNGLRIGSFGFATTLGLLVGLLIRAYQPFELPLDKHLARWKGFPDSVVHQMVVYERTGIKPARMTFEEGGESVEVSAEAGPSVRNNVLVAGHTEAVGLCKRLDPNEWGGPEDILVFYDSLGRQDALMKEIAGGVREIAAEDRGAALEVVRKVICSFEAKGAE